MAVSNINPHAAAGIYEAAQKAPKLELSAHDIESTKATPAFNKVMAAQQNKFASMRPEEILQHIKGVQQNSHTPAAGNNNTGLFTAVTRGIKSELGKAEDTTRKAMIGEAALLDLMTDTQKAKTTLQTMTTLRNKLLEEFNKILNMNI